LVLRRILNWLVTAGISTCLLGIACAASAQPKTKPSGPAAGNAEARLIAIYKEIGSGSSLKALSMADALVADHPNFQLAQLVRGDLLASRVRPVTKLGDVPDTQAQLALTQLNDLREESRLRIASLKERPPANAWPSSIWQLSAANKHVIALDTSRSRLYLFENHNGLPKLVADYYISVGKSGVDKLLEGDAKTPLGVYFVTNSVGSSKLDDFYGAGALPLNYPNPVDTRRGKTGSGIWLHGTPPEQFSRQPRATDGCVVMSNPDLESLLQRVEAKTTPVVIARKLEWQNAYIGTAAKQSFELALNAWRSAKTGGVPANMLSHYAPDFSSYGKTLKDWAAKLQADVKLQNGRPLELQDLSMLYWKDAAGEMVVATFKEVSGGKSTKPSTRQYWIRIGSQWKIAFEGNVP
jgi:murein L,D-transpeptidase YafK